MKINDILKQTQHRPWKMPTKKWSFYQEWNHTLFLHWKVEVSELKKFVPESLEIDLFEGKAWVSLVAFTMEKIRPKHLPAFPPISTFDEINVRTYVKANGKTGVYFLSIEGGKKLSCLIAKNISKLPYRFSKIKRSKNHFESHNNNFNDHLFLNYKVSEKILHKNPIDNWLTERYALFQDYNQYINEFEIHHLEWDIYNLTLSNIEVNYPYFKNLINNTPDKIQYSPGVQVVAWNKTKLTD